MSAFGSTIPVTGLLLGFPGKPSRMGKRTIAARQVLSTTANPILFGAPVVINPTTDTYQSVADFVAAGGAFTGSLFAGVAVAEVQTTYGYPYNPGTAILGSFLQGLMAEAMEEGSITVQFQTAATSTQVSQNPIYIRVALNSAYAAAVVGGYELFSDAAVSTTGTASSGSTALTVASGTGIVVGQIVTGTGIAAGTSVAAVTGTAVTLSQNTTAALSTTAVVFASNQVIPGVVARTTYLDTNNIGEITLKNRVAA